MSSSCRNTCTRAMSEGARSYRVDLPDGHPALMDGSLSVPKAQPAAYPLDDLYARSGRSLPAIDVIQAHDMPEPYRGLLAHNHDMTPTLSAFYARIIHLRVLSSHHRDDFYFREVVLVADELEKPVEFGAIRINLALFAPSVRRHILDERVPLGHLLRQHSVSHSSKPKAYLRLQADALMMSALNFSGPQVLYGRRNTLSDSVGRPLAEVVEILPPAESGGA